MKNKKGFTLTELLAVLVILALIMTLAFPNFSDFTTKAKSNYDRSTQILIRSAAKMYVNNNIEEIEIALKTSNSYCLPIGKLVAYEYLDSDLKDSKNQNIPENRCVYVTKSGKNYEYRIGTSSSEIISSSIDYKPPIINIVGTNCKNVMNVNSYTDFDNTCTIRVTDNKDATKTFKPIKEKETDNKLSKVVTQDKNKIFITYNAKDAAGNKSLPLQIELELPE